MDLFLLNNLTGNLEKFDHNKDIPIKWYTCGPTIYNNSHLGHARTFITFDVIRRVLSFLGYNIIYVMNITDIDDKIINKVKQLSPNNEVNEEIYYKFIKEMENDFWKDMDTLGVLRPTVVTRVTEYIDKIKHYIEKIESNGLTYTSNGTVYIDSKKYVDCNLQWNFFGLTNNSDYSQCEFTAEKKSPADFSLWKASKPGELKFDSKWGNGRCSWSIECSVMSHDILGEYIDIHSGGIDLKYPHHCNEMIQSIAYSNGINKIPVKTFLHSGHLNINGEKMANSSTNFITIRKYLETHTARQLRILFLIHSWNKPMDLNQNTIDEAEMVEKRIIDFYCNMEQLQRTNNKNESSLNEVDTNYLNGFIKFKNEIYQSLLNNIDTKNVIKLLLEWVQATYKYTNNKYNLTLVNNSIEYITQILNVFGLDFKTTKSNNDSDVYIDILVNFRQNIRNIVKNGSKDIPKQTLINLFKELDLVRDNELKGQGIIIEDLGENNKKWKRVLS